ncbi:MAG: hypothetical protein PHP64_00055 [Actinomycetota bacterium]|nr:hypothetical protein [Actinomycetota bacterium]
MGFEGKNIKTRRISSSLIPGGIDRTKEKRISRVRLMIIAVSVVLSISIFCVCSTYNFNGVSAGSNFKPSVCGSLGKKTMQNRRVLLVVVDRIGLDDIASAESQLPNISKVIKDGSFGLMNARCRNGVYGLESYTAIGASGWSLGVGNVGSAFNSSERFRFTGNGLLTAREIYESITGKQGSGKVLNLSIEEMKRESESSRASSRPGLLGETLKQAGIKVAVFGNSDSLSIPGANLPTEGLSVPYATTAPNLSTEDMPLNIVSRRQVSCIGMDENGIVPFGDVSSKSYSGTNGLIIHSDFGWLSKSVEGALANCNFVIVDMGETSRVDERSDMVTDMQASKERVKALKRCDAALGEMLKSLNPASDLLIVCAPTPTRRMISDGEILTPLLFYGPGFSNEKSICSRTTRKEGLVSNLDIAPTVLDFFGVDIPVEMNGQPITETGKDLSYSKNIEKLDSLLEKSVYFSGNRSIFINISAISASVLAVLFFLAFLIRRDMLLRHTCFWSVLMIAVLSAPFVYLILPVVPVHNLFFSIPFSIALQVLIALLVYCSLDFYKNKVAMDEEGLKSGKEASNRLYFIAPRAIFIVSVLTIAGIFIDAALSSARMSFSPFGNSLTWGFRYYGIGNIYMGVSIGAAILLACTSPIVFRRILDKNWKVFLFTLCLFTITVLFLGISRLGANTGGFATAAIAFSIFPISFGRNLNNRKKVAICIALFLFFLVIPVALDFLVPAPVSHFGSAVAKVEGGKFGEVVNLALYKLSMSFTLLRFSIWRIPFYIALVLSAIWAFKPRVFSEIREKYPYLGSFGAEMIVGMIFVILLNDSGIEASGNMGILLMISVLLLYFASNSHDHVPN